MASSAQPPGLGSEVHGVNARGSENDTPTDDPATSRWREFAENTAASHVPAPVHDGLDRADMVRAFRARALKVHQFTFNEESMRIINRGNILGIRISASFYDESSGRFFGTTVSGKTTHVPIPDDYHEQKLTKKNNADVLQAIPALTEPIWTNLDVYFTTSIADSTRLMLFELILVETHPLTNKVLRETRYVFFIP